MDADTRQPVRTTPLGERLRAKIAAGGPISLHDYMEACLYDADHGYYRRAQPLGAGGDFVTAPEISQVVGEMIGLWVADTWTRMGSPAQVQLVELGPGRGTLMADMLRILKVAPRFLAACSVRLVETSATLMEMQRLALAGAPVPVEWLPNIDALPAGATILIANEYFDCLPVRQFEWSSVAGWRERMVGVDELGNFVKLLEKPGASAPVLPADAEDGAVFEHRPGVEHHMANFARRAATDPFAAVLIDYGHDETPGSAAYGDTVQAVRGHRFATIFDTPGETDLSAHVDFGHIRRLAQAHGLSAWGALPMGQFLLKLGAGERLAQLTAAAGTDQAQRLRRGVSRLVDPAQMGALFKVMALTSAGVGAPAPFDATGTNMPESSQRGYHG
jgi:SAM-dependent MidA family methyltransferase